jgi:AraC-like DNA-binding protein
VSPARQPLTVNHEEFLLVRSMAATLTTGHLIHSHTHSWRQLLCAFSGAMTVFGGRSSWMVPPGYAVFIPAGGVHSIRMWGDVAARSLYFPSTLESQALEAPACRVVRVSPLLRELVRRAVEWHALDSRVPAHQRLLAVLLDELAIAQANLEIVNPLLLPLPSDTRALAVAQHVLHAPACEDTIDDLSRRYASSRRTLERLFQRETGLSFGLWRQKVRMLDSIRLLAEGRSVTDASLDAGYSSLSAFIAAFKKTFGYTPGRLENTLS